MTQEGQSTLQQNKMTQKKSKKETFSSVVRTLMNTSNTEFTQYLRREEMKQLEMRVLIELAIKSGKMETKEKEFNLQLQQIVGDGTPNFLILSRELDVQKDTLERWWKGEIIPTKVRQEKSLEVFKKHFSN